jgi:hypothetical protein
LVRPVKPDGPDGLEMLGIEYDNFVVASTLTHDGEIITIGILGMVFVVDE